MSYNNPFTAKSDLLKSFTLLSYARLASPISNPTNVNEVTFKRFGISQAGEEFNNGWYFGISDASNAKYLQAYCMGSLFFEEGATTNRLILQNGDMMGSVLWKDEVPDWFPMLASVIYENIDEALTRELLKEYLDGNPKLFESLTKDIGGVSNTDMFLDKYFSLEINVGIPVRAGSRIAVAGSGTDHDREVRIYVQVDLDSGLFVDPAIYPVHWENYFIDLQGHNLYAHFTDMFGPLVANGIIRYVGSNGSETGDFLNPAAPAKYVSSAVEAANDYDTVLILDKGDVNLGEKYTENVEIRKPVSITYLNPARIDVTTDVTSLDTFDWPDLPIVTGSLGGSVIGIFQVEGYVSISNLIITGGSFPSSKDYEVKGGGGILAYLSDKTYVSNCFVTRNEVPLGAELDGHGGGVYAYESSSYIFKCNVSGNESSERGGGIFVGRYGWPVIRKNIISLNQSTGARADGGGIAATVAHPGTLSFDEAALEKARQRRIRIIGNQINNNTAEDDGGGVYLSVMAKALFKNNDISFNIAWKAGGGVRASLGSDIEMTQDSIHDNQCSFHFEPDPADLMNGGGGVATRNSDLILTNVILANNINHAFAGGGIFFASSSEGAIGGGEESDLDNWAWLGISSYDDILRDYFLKTEVHIECKGGTTISGNISSRFESQAEDNRKGGGLYLLRYRADDFSALPLIVRIENFIDLDNNYNDKITQLAGDFAQGVVDDAFGAQNPDSADFHLYDMIDEHLPADQQQLINGVANTRTGIAFLDDENSFEYQSRLT